jgi:cardiolipin synthase
MLTLPNFLTLLRIVAIPLFLVYLANGNHAAAFILFLGAGVTDCVDGAVARLTDSGSSLGAMLDPLADKLLLLTSFVVLGVTGAIPLWLVVLLVSRDLIVVLGWVALYLVHQESMTVAPSRLGKVTTFLQLFTVGFVLMSLARPALPLEMVNAVSQLVTALATGASGVQYVYRGLLWHQRRSSVTPSQGAVD